MALLNNPSILSMFCCLILNFGYSQYPKDSFNLNPPQQLEELTGLSLWPTEYYVHRTISTGIIPYLNDAGDTLGYYSDLCNFCTACLEGTVSFESDTSETVVLNYSSRAEKALVDCRKCQKFANSKLNVESWGKVRWKISSGFGEGVLDYKLVPHRTIAVDPRKIEYGQVIFIPEAVGTKIITSDGSTYLHDGYFFAGDTGGAIKENHIDVFTGFDESHPFRFVQSNPKITFLGYLVTDHAILESIKVLHLE